MAELTFKSAGVSTREIDLSGPTAVKPQGVPAGIIGTAQKGPAFVPVTVATFKDFVAEFGGTDGKKFGPLAMHEWMKNARSGCFVRVLGAGDATKRDGTSGRVTNAGFVVGAQLPQNTDDPAGGLLDINPFATDNAGDQVSGRTYFLGGLYREPYTEGASAATAEIAIDPDSFEALAADFLQDGRSVAAAGEPQLGVGVRLVDHTGAAHVTIWLHEGESDLADGAGTSLADFHDALNIPVSAGSRAAADVTVVSDPADLVGRFLEITDKLGNKFRVEFTNGGGHTDADVAEVGDYSAGEGITSAVCDTSLTAASADVADWLALQLTGSEDSHQFRATAGTVDVDTFELRLDDFGDAKDEPDGGAVINGDITVNGIDGLAASVQGFSGGLSRTGQEIARAVVDQVAAVTGGITADLTFSVSSIGALVATQGATGTDGNDFDPPDADADGEDDFTAGSASLTLRWDIAEHTLEVDALPAAGGTDLKLVDIDGNELFFSTDATDPAGREHVYGGAAVGSEADPFVLGTAPDAAAQITLVFDDPAAALHEGDEIKIADTASAEVASLQVKSQADIEAAMHLVLLDSEVADMKAQLAAMLAEVATAQLLDDALGNTHGTVLTAVLADIGGPLPSGNNDLNESGELEAADAALDAAAAGADIESALNDAETAIANCNLDFIELCTRAAVGWEAVDAADAAGHNAVETAMAAIAVDSAAIAALGDAAAADAATCGAQPVSVDDESNVIYINTVASALAGLTTVSEQLDFALGENAGAGVTTDATTARAVNHGAEPDGAVDATTLTLELTTAGNVGVDGIVTTEGAFLVFETSDEGFDEGNDITYTVDEVGYTEKSLASIATVIGSLIQGLDPVAGTAIDGVTPLNVRVDDDDAATLTITSKSAGEWVVGTFVEANWGGTAINDTEVHAGADGLEPADLADAVNGLTETDFSGGDDSDEPDHTVLKDAGVDTASASKPLIRAVIMTPQGVAARLVSDNTDAESGDGSTWVDVNGGGTAGGSEVGLVTTTGTQERFTLLLNGHVGTSEFPATLRCSLDPQAPDYFMNVMNHDASCMEKAGHYVYAHYNVYQSLAAIDATGHSVVSAGDDVTAAFLVPGKSAAHADDDGASADAASTPNYEDFQERFQTAHSPWVVSQVYGAKVKNLFRVHALDDGVAGSGKFKISIANVMMDSQGRHGQFDLFVRAINDDDIAPVVFEKFIGLDLNPQSERYISRVIGDQYMYYDFDKRPGSQKLVVDGIHPTRSKYVRIEMAPEVDAGSVPVDALPMGYRGYHHLSTSANEAAIAAASIRFLKDGLTHLTSLRVDTDGDGAVDAIVANQGTVINDATEPPVPMRSTIAVGQDPKKRAAPQLYWGTHFQVCDDTDEPNKNTKFNDSILSHCKYFPRFNLSGQALVSVGNNPGVEDLHDDTLVSDCDRFNNNFFSLERIQVVTKSPSQVSLKNPNVSGVLNQKEWAVAEYRRDGALNSSITTADGTLVSGDADIDTRFIDPQTDMIDPSTRRFMKFSFFLQGGFDGTNIFNQEKQFLTNRAAVWEMDDVDQGGVEGSTIASFRKAVDVMAEKADVDIKLLTIPGMREEAVTDYAIDAVEDRFDAMFIMDVEEKAVNNDLMIDYDSQKPSVNLTVENLVSRNLDSSFAAAYFPDVVITDPALGTNVQCPPSVAVLGAFSLNDSIAHPWFAPAGFSRGALKSVVETQVKLSRRNLDTLYESDINPLAAFPHTPGVVVWGQKTLQQAQSALDRVNVRRLLIEIRREVRRVGNGLLFEPNREETLGRFSAAVNPILQRIQQQQGLDKFKVVIDTTTTTQADIENNTVRGKIFLQPTRTVEFISLDFVVTNAGMEV